MPFVPCETLFGQAAIVTGAPAVLSDVDCVYRPYSQTVFLDRDPSWGLYSLDGKIIPAGSYTRGEKSTLIGQSEFIAPDDEIALNEEEHIYFGPLIPHYGHFIVTSLARAWFAAAERPEKVKLLCHSERDMIEHDAGSFIRGLTSALGLTPDAFTCPRVPTRFSRLTIPEPAFLEQKMAYQVFVEPMHRIGDRFLGETALEPIDRPLYLSKSKLKHGSVSTLTNEVQIEEILKSKNIDICYPEQLSLQDQVRTLAQRRKIIGFAGSAFHTHIFLREPPTAICVGFDEFINSNFILLDKLNNSQSKYFFPDKNLGANDTEGFGISRVVDNIPLFVEDLLMAAEISSQDLFPGIEFPSNNNWNVTMYNENCVPDHTGENYQETLARLHLELNPKTYLEIGTLTGNTLAISKSRSISIDPNFQISSAVIGEKPLCLFYQLESDVFFDRYDPKALLGSTLDFSFLDGMHHCEFLLRDFINAERHASPDGIIVLHDCLPVEIPMTDRTQNGTPPTASHRGGWWTGDVWRTLTAIKKHRPDLNILCLDAAPTGLVIISGLNAKSRKLQDNLSSIVEEMMSIHLEEITVAGFLKQIDIQSTSLYSQPGNLSAAIRKS